MENHPSPENIKIDVFYRHNEMLNARGTVASSKVVLTDTEPARSDSISPVLNIMRRIVDPANKKSFNRLVGEEYAADYKPWWDKNIKPIWGAVNKKLREDPYYSESKDVIYNNQFNNQAGMTIIRPAKSENVSKVIPLHPQNELSIQPPKDKYQKIGDKIASILRKIFG